MSKWNRFLTAAVVALFFAGMAAADTLELKDGRVLRGKYLGGTQAVLRFEVNGEVQTFNTTDIVALTFTGRYASAAPAAMADKSSTSPPTYTARFCITHQSISKWLTLVAMVSNSLEVKIGSGQLAPTQINTRLYGRSRGLFY